MQAEYTNEINFDEDLQMIECFPALLGCRSHTDASKIMFGIKSLTSLVDDVWSGMQVQMLNEFFKGNPSDLVAWNEHRKTALFYALPAHAKTYRRLIVAFGLKTAVAFTQESDFADLCTGWDFMCSDTKRKARFNENITKQLHNWPAGCHYKMIHDYIVDQMNANERKHRPKGEVPVTLPQPAIAIPAVAGDYQVLVPRNETELKRIGTAQGHCVGTRQMGYANKVKHGEVWIFVLYRKTLQDGVCVEVDRGGYSITQAQGKHRRSPDQAEYTQINNVIDLLKQERLLTA